MKTLTEQEFGNLFDSFKGCAFRFESLDRYVVPEEAGEYSRFLQGEPLPTTNEDEWVQFVKRCVINNKKIQRIHAISMPLTPYLKYEIEWGYAYSRIAGEEIYLMDRNLISEDTRKMADFWLFDQEILVIMRYDLEGRFMHGELEDSPSIIAKHVKVMSDLLSIATPLTKFLAQVRGA